MPFFSVIIPTRNRPEVVAEAVRSVLSQDFVDLEILLVDDGSDIPLSEDQLNISREESDKLKIIRLDFQPCGRGPSYTRNVGIWSSSGDYCAFLDDDDIWIKDDHLSVAHKALSQSGQSVDLYLSNQEAFVASTGDVSNLWLYSLVNVLAQEKRELESGCYRVTAGDLIASAGFCHLNTSIVRRQLLDEISGLDANLGYEEDFDFYLRAIDAAQKILFCPDIIARHNVPDRTKKNNVSTLFSEIDRLNIRLYILNKNMLSATSPDIVDHCEEFWVQTLRLMAEKCVQRDDYVMASRLLRRALGARFSLKWQAYGIFISVKAALEKRSDRVEN